LIDCRFNKRRENFKTEREYNDYLEMVEDISMFRACVRLQPTRCKV